MENERVVENAYSICSKRERKVASELRHFVVQDRKHRFVIFYAPKGEHYPRETVWRIYYEYGDEKGDWIYCL